MNSAWGKSPVAQILQRFVRFFRLWFGRWQRLWLQFVFGVFDESRERTSAAGVYSAGFFLFPSLFLFSLSLATGAATWEASGHFHGFGAEVDLRVVFVEPSESKDHALFSETGHC